jgi:hypothetical protein
MDMNGKICQEELQMIPGGMQSGSIDLNRLSPGVYFLQVVSNNNIFTEKLVIE